MSAARRSPTIVVVNDDDDDGDNNSGEFDIAGDEEDDVKKREEKFPNGRDATPNHQQPYHHSTAMTTTVILVLWKLRPNLAARRWTNRQNRKARRKLVVVAPTRLLVDETWADVVHRVQLPLHDASAADCQLIAKTRELAAGHVGADRLVLLAFESALLGPLAQVRLELGIPGPLPQHLQMLDACADLRIVAKRGSIATVRHIVFGGGGSGSQSIAGSGSGGTYSSASVIVGSPSSSSSSSASASFGKEAATALTARARTALGDFPMFVRSTRFRFTPSPSSSTGRRSRNEYAVSSMSSGKRKDDARVVRDGIELRNWLMDKQSSWGVLLSSVVVSECLFGGVHFTAVLATSSSEHMAARLIGSAIRVESEDLTENARWRTPYALEWLSVDATRDALPGLESFVTQVARTLQKVDLLPVTFVKGYYRDHTDITYLGVRLVCPSDSLRTLISTGHHQSWESLSIDAAFGEDESSFADNRHAATEIPSYLLNFPTVNGVLLHQSGEFSRDQSTETRVLWRVAENEEMRAAKSIDDNIVQVVWRGVSPDGTRILSREEARVKVLKLLSSAELCVERSAQPSDTVISSNDREDLLLFCQPSHVLSAGSGAPNNSLSSTARLSTFARSCTTAD